MACTACTATRHRFKNTVSKRGFFRTGAGTAETSILTAIAACGRTIHRDRTCTIEVFVFRWLSATVSTLCQFNSFARKRGVKVRTSSQQVCVCTSFSHRCCRLIKYIYVVGMQNSCSTLTLGECSDVLITLIVPSIVSRVDGSAARCAINTIATTAAAPGTAATAYGHQLVCQNTIIF